MYHENDYVIYQKGVCQIQEIIHDDKQKYYLLRPINEPSLKIKVPITNQMGFLRSIISRENAYQLINSIPLIEPLDNIEDKYIERTYKELLHRGTYEDLIKIIKTAYLRNDDRLKNNKKASEKDSNYFNQAEKYLYDELAIALNMSFDEVKNYVISQVEALIK